MKKIFLSLTLLAIISCLSSCKSSSSFENDVKKMDPASTSALEEIAAMLLANPQKRIFMNSFSEGIGDGVKNYQLSVARAKAARRWLNETHGVPIKQVVIKAYGEAFPEFADENDLKNRRMTFDFAPQDAQDNAF